MMSDWPRRAKDKHQQFRTIFKNSCYKIDFTESGGMCPRQKTLCSYERLVEKWKGGGFLKGKKKKKKVDRGRLPEEIKLKRTEFWIFFYVSNDFPPSFTTDGIMLHTWLSIPLPFGRTCRAEQNCLTNGQTLKRQRHWQRMRFSTSANCYCKYWHTSKAI